MGLRLSPLTPQEAREAIVEPAKLDGDCLSPRFAFEEKECLPGLIDFIDGAVTEASGIVPSPTTPGLLWLHNDSGDDAQLFAVATDGTVRGALRLPDVVAIDFEDIAAAPCPDASAACLWIADTGDNDRVRASLALYAVREPAIVLSRCRISSPSPSDRPGSKRSCTAVATLLTF